MDKPRLRTLQVDREAGSASVAQRCLLSRFESQLPVAITCSLMPPVSVSVSSLFHLIGSDQCVLGSPPSKLLALKSLTQDLFLGTAHRQVPMTPTPLCRP